MLTLVAHTCQQCGADFQTQKGAAHMGKFCSRACRDSWMSRKVAVSCARCGTGLGLPPSHVRPRNYCSRECRKLGQSVTLLCEVCQAAFTVFQRRAGTARFCSMRCKAIAQDEGKRTAAMKIRQSAAYRAWRTAVFVRDDFICQHCGKRGGLLNADHIKQFAMYPELRLDVDNGQTLCE